MHDHECTQKERLESIDKKVDQILTALKGNELGTTGVIPRLDKVERKVSILNIMRIKLVTTTSIISTIIASIVTFIIAWFTKS